MSNLAKQLTEETRNSIFMQWDVTASALISRAMNHKGLCVKLMEDRLFFDLYDAITATIQINKGECARFAHMGLRAKNAFFEMACFVELLDSRDRAAFMGEVERLVNMDQAF